MTKSLASRWFDRPVNTARAALRLYCFPYAGGSSAMYRSWVGHAPSDVEIVGVELPGRGHRIHEPLLPDLSCLAGEAADAIAGTGDTRFAFFGHSMGALLAFEVARALRAAGRPAPRHLFVSAARAPHFYSTRRPVALMSNEEFISKLKDLNGTPDLVLRDPELMELFLPVLKADFSAVDGWLFRPERPLKVPITAFGGRADPHVGVEALQGWKDHTSLGFHLRMFPGDHFFIQAGERNVLDFLFRDLEVEVCV
ncbi:MAG TPA: alpha/beta fold hydrolase [Bryobacteraceae bacterium]|nr:alpha/beta fold hydrolase [Bryobacteraceae bacterium]